MNKISMILGVLGCAVLSNICQSADVRLVMGEGEFFATLGQTYNLKVHESLSLQFQTTVHVGGSINISIKLVEGSSVVLEKHEDMNVTWLFKAVKPGVTKFEVLLESWSDVEFKGKPYHNSQKKELIFNVSPNADAATYHNATSSDFFNHGFMDGRAIHHLPTLKKAETIEFSPQSLRKDGTVHLFFNVGPRELWIESVKIDKGSAITLTETADGLRVIVKDSAGKRTYEGKWQGLMHAQ